MTPEEVTRTFINAIADGNCEDALELSIETAKEGVETRIETGCQKDYVEIKSIDCPELSDNSKTIECNCVEIRTSKDHKLKYTLTKVDGEWKVSNWSKDFDPRNFRIGNNN